MKTFTREEQRLLILLGACFLVASAVLLCFPGYTSVVPITARRASAASVPTRPPPRATPGTQRLNPNFASFNELVAVPGIGPALARNILLHREGNILFNARDMLHIRGIGKAKWATLSPYFCFGTSPPGPPSPTTSGPPAAGRR